MRVNFQTKRTSGTQWSDAKSIYATCSKFMQHLSLLLILLSQYIVLSQQQSVISLSNAQWFVGNSNNSIVIPAQVPGGIYSDLRRSNVLKQDLLFGKNDVAYRWVGNENWTYTTLFTIDHQIAVSQSVKLVLHGVDTISTVYLNGQEVGTTDNMFVRYKFDLKPHLKLAGLKNLLTIKFESPVKYSARKSHQSIRDNKGKIIPPYCPSPAQRGECHVNFIRKMQASFSWDWGPAFPSVGIYKDIEIEYGSFGIVRDILVETRRFPPLIQQSRLTTPKPVIISSSRNPIVQTSPNKTVPYIRAPPYYVPLNSENHHLLMEQLPTLDITNTNDSNHQLLEENWLLKITLVAEMVQPSFGYNLRIEFNLDGILHYESEHINVIANSDGYIRLGFNLRIDSSRLPIRPWWPNNLGKQTLYRLTARMMPIPNAPATDGRHSRSILSERANEFGSDEIHSLEFRAKPLQTTTVPMMIFLATSLENNANQVSEKEISFGFRTVELIQEPVTKGNIEDGLTFNFRINGVDLFAMGSNWIPASVLPEYSNDLEYVRYLLQSAKDANMNMLRVWGGGLYESDEFYKMADEMGIMIWHDFMFACALYPTDDDFLSTVRTEIEQQVQRLQYHPSIILWAGNNENEMAIAGPWWPEVLVWSKKLREAYAKLYVDTIKPIVQILDPTRPFVESSPSNGILSQTQPHGIARTPNENKYGDVHHYDYLADSFDWNSYPSTRFASEYGFQSYPSFSAIASFTSSADWKYPLSSNILHRQHRLTGETEMKIQMKMHFNDIPSGGVESLKTYLYVSQLTQAIAIKTETEFYRRNRFIDPETKLGHTMGALYWQLNDVWQAPTWSSIEYGGKWKMLHYFARRFFFPIQVMPYLIQPPSSISNSIQQAFAASNNLITSLHNRLQQFGDSQHASQQQAQQSPPSSPVLVVDLVRDDLFHLLDSFNVTIRFFRWTSFTPVWQDTVYVAHTRPQNVTRIYEQDVGRIMRQTGGFSLSSGVFQVLIEQQPRLGLSQIDNYLMPVVPSKVTAMRVPKLTVRLVQGPFELTDVRGESQNSGSSAQWACAYRLTLQSDSVAMFVWLELNLLNIMNAEQSPEAHNSASSHHSQSMHGEPIQLHSTQAKLSHRPSRDPIDHQLSDFAGEEMTTAHSLSRRARSNSKQFEFRHNSRRQKKQQLSFKPIEGSGSNMLRYQFSDNAFNMFEPSKLIDLYLSRCLSLAQVEVALEVQSLADSL